MDSFLFEHWWYHLPNYVIAAVMYTLLARFFMQLFVPPNWDNYIWRWFCRLTDWAIAAARVVTPSYVVSLLLPAIAFFWLLYLRLIFGFLMQQWGLAPTLSPA